MRISKENFNGSSEYFKQVIKHLIELNNYPDISIKYFNHEFGLNERVRAELILCTGKMIVGEYIAETQALKDEAYKKYIEDCLLREIAYKYIKRAYDERKTGKIKAVAPNYLRSCQNIRGKL